MTHQKTAGHAPALGVVCPAHSQASSQQAYDLANLDQQSLEELELMADEWVNRLQDVKVRPAFRINRTSQVTLEPCTHCGQMAVCLPVMGRQGIRTYPYCVEKCWPAAFNGSQQTTNNRGVCDCCGEFTVVRPVRLATGLTKLNYCAMCRSPALRTMRDVPHCIFCKDRLRPHQYERGVCGECW